MGRVNIKNIILVGLLLLLFMPLIQKTFPFVEVKPLNGTFWPIAEPDSIQINWFSGEYQKQYEGYFNENFGLRTLLVRLYNQYTYSLYEQVHCLGVIVGKNNQLFQDFYIDAYSGKDFVGITEIQEKCFKLKKIQDTLSNKGIHLIVMLAPGKADFFPEYIPEEYNEILHKNLPTNYQLFSSELKEKKINTIDFNKWYIEHKDKTDFPLYPQGGVHWSVYGAAFAADTLIENMKRIANENYIDIKINRGEIRDTIPVPDRELTDGMNLIFPLPAYKTAFPNLEFDTVNRTKPNVLTISDSYFNNLNEVGLFKNGFSDQSLNLESFYMSHSVFTNNYLYVSLLDLQKEIESRKFVIIITTAPNLNRFGWGFIEKTYDLYFNIDKKKEKEEQIKKWETKIIHTPEWYESVKQQAKEKGNTIEVELKLHAEYMIWKEETTP